MKSINILAFLAVMYTLNIASSIFVPFFMAAFLWLIIFMIGGALSELLRKWGAPAFAIKLSGALSIVVVASAAWLVVSVIAHQSGAVVAGFERYTHNFHHLISAINSRFGVDIDFAAAISAIDLKRLASMVLHQSAGITQGFFMVLLYLVFMILEEKSMARKIPLLFKDKKMLDKKMLGNIMASVRTYLLVKTWASAATALLGFLLMVYIGLDFAIFFAMLLFVCNYIPFVGSIVASTLPVALAVLQFPDTLSPAIGLGIGLLTIQVGIGQLVEPRYLGNSVGISPLALLMSLVIFGWLWGVAGMFLCVPAMIIINIVLSNIPSTKRISILLSNGEEKCEN